MQNKHILFLLILLFCQSQNKLHAQDGGQALITSASQLSSPYSDSVEGTNIGYLIDGNTNTFWHSDWHNYNANDKHWVQITLNETVTGLVSLYMHRRNATNDHPTRIVVSGSTNGTTWKELATLDLPYQGFSGVNSEPWAIREAVKHIRLTVTDCVGSGTGFRTFWHAAEIQLYHLSNEYEFSNDLSGIKINEVQVANIDQFIDPSFNYGGWIELYNPTDALRSLDKAKIRHTDAEGMVEEATLGLGHGLLKSKDYICLWFDHNSEDGTYGGESHLQIPFKMDSEGGMLELVDANGTVVDQVVYPPVISRCSYARTTDGGEAWGWTAAPSLQASNAGSTFATDRLSAPVISHESTLFDKSISFKVEIPEGATLRYTTDGSAPTATHGVTTKNGSFTAFTTKVYRFVLVADGKLPSQVVTRSFIKEENNLELPVLNIATHPDNLYDDVIGVYTKGTNGVAGKGQDVPCNWNMDWERPVNVEYMVKGEDGYRTVINQEAEFKIAGGWTRAYGGGNGWEMKSSFRLKSGKLYEGKNSFDYPFFSNSKPYNKYKTLQVRNGGNDTYARFIDPSIHEIFRRSGYYMDTQAWQPCHVYFNGKYLGMLNLRENNNKHYGESGYGIDTDEMDQFELDPVIGYVQKTGTKDAFNQWLSLSKQLAANPTDESIWEEICQLVNIDEYCNYMAAECYIGSTDWMTNCNNIKGFRSRKDNGKFHLVMFDADAAFNSRNMVNEIHNLLNNYDGRFSDNNGKNVLAEVFFNMMAYEPFRHQFTHAFCIVDGSIMQPEWAVPIIDEMEATTTSALALEGNSPSGSADFVTNAVSNESSRNERLTGLKNYLKQSSTYRMSIESNIPEARLLIDGQEIPTRKFDGHLFAPFTLTVKAPAGYTFREWSLVSNSAAQEELIPFKGTWLYYDKGSLDNTGWKEKAYTPSGWKSGKAPFGYGTVGTSANAADYSTTLDYGGDAGNKRPTYYFRKTVNLSEKPGHEDRFFLYYYLDDGALFYVNGTEVGSNNCNSGITYNTYSTGTVGNVATYGTIEIPSSLLNAGSNIVAVEVHNTNAASSDIFFEARFVKAKFETSVTGNSETLPLSELFEAGNYRLTAVYDKIEDPLKLLEAGASPIRINEVSAGNDIYINEYFKKNDWIELYNTTDRDIDIAGMYLSDNRSNPQKYRIPSDENGINTLIPAHGHLIVWCDKLTPLSQLHAPFKLDNADGASVSLQAADGTWADEIVYFAQNRWQTFGRYPDGGNHTTHLNRPTIELPNMMGKYDFAETDNDAWNGTDMAITLGLAKGWNWTSHNLAEDTHASRFTGYAQSILGKQESYTKDEEGWTGNLNAIKAATGYKIQMSEAADITLRGPLFDTQVPVALQEGWNWIGCPLYNTTTIEAALGDYTPTEGDALIGIEGFTTYEDGKWEGTLTSLSPGQAYLLKCGTTQSFCWNSLSQPTRRTRRYDAPIAEDTAESLWKADIHAYPNVTAVVAMLEINGQPATEGNFTLGAFCGEECRGVAQHRNGLLYINVHGEGGETLSFRLIDAEGQILKLEQTLTLQPETLVGNRAVPFRLTLEGDGIQAPTSAGARPVGVTYYQIDGQQITKPTTAGVFLQKTTYENGHVVTKKITR